MKRGISPVVATILLVAISVIASVSVWFWASPFAGKPALTEASTKGYVVTVAYSNSSNDGCNKLDIRNTGGSTLTNVVLEVRDYLSGKPAGANGTDPSAPAYVNISIPLAPGASFRYNISSLGNASNKVSLPIGTYRLRASQHGTVTGVSDQIFTCTGGNRLPAACINFSHTAELFYEEFDNLNAWSVNAWSALSDLPYNGSYYARHFGSTSTPYLKHNQSTLAYYSINLSYWGTTSSATITGKWYNGTGWTTFSSVAPGSYTYYSYLLPSTASYNPDFQVDFTCSTSSVSLCYVDTFRIIANYTETICSED